MGCNYETQELIKKNKEKNNNKYTHVYEVKKFYLPFGLIFECFAYKEIIKDT